MPPNAEEIAAAAADAAQAAEEAAALAAAKSSEDQAAEQLRVVAKYVMFHDFLISPIRPHFVIAGLHKRSISSNFLCLILLSKCNSSKLGLCTIARSRQNLQVNASRGLTRLSRLAISLCFDPSVVQAEKMPQKMTPFWPSQISRGS